MNMIRAIPVLALGLMLAAQCARSDEDLDAELDAAWGKGSKAATATAMSPQQQYEAKMKMLQAQRDAGMARCRAKSGGQRYCANYADEQYRKARRALEDEFEGQLDDTRVVRDQPKGFGRR